MTGYQKLKKENQQLREDIFKILNNDIEVISKYKFLKQMSDAKSWGSPSISVKPCAAFGLLPMIKK
jgi:hypothetical protein